MFKINNKTTLPSLKRKQKHKTLASKTLNFNVLYAEKEVYRSQCRKKKTTSEKYNRGIYVKKKKKITHF